MLYAVVPVKILVRAKTRLAPALSFTQRLRLARQFLHSTLELLSQYPGARRTIVVSADLQALTLASSRGMTALPQTAAGGINRAVEMGCQHARRRGAKAVLVLPTDLPCLNVRSLRQFTKPVATPIVRIAADRHMSGTNALYLQPPLIGFASFGHDSLRRHRERAKSLGARFEVVREPCLQLDIDLPADLNDRQAWL